MLSSKSASKVAKAPKAKTAIEEALLRKEKDLNKKVEERTVRSSSLDRGKAILKRMEKTIDEKDRNGLLPEQLDAWEAKLREEAERLSR